MRIIDTKTPKVYVFNDIPSASAFRFVDTEEWGDGVYMRIPLIIDENNDALRAIDLSNGFAVSVCDEEEVIPCEAEVVIK